ncbi:MAG: dihydropteroate synthase [bacterium]
MICTIEENSVLNLLNRRSANPDKSCPIIMGILNVTPDSFYDGGKYLCKEHALIRALELQKQGAEILDIGGESSRPGSLPVSADEELSRVIPVIQKIRAHSNISLSIDTCKSEVAREALMAGCDMVNDISGMTFDPNMTELILKTGCPVCLMHMKGIPHNMQKNPFYGDVVQEVYSWLCLRADYARKAGINDNKIILDPGIGFGKRVEDNIEIIRSIRKFKETGYALLIGVSRKSFIHHLFTVPDPNLRLGGSLGAQLFCAKQGVDIIRTHDVGQAIQCIRLYDILEDTNAVF